MDRIVRNVTVRSSLYSSGIHCICSYTSVDLTISDVTTTSFSAEWNGPYFMSYTILLTEQETGTKWYFFAIQLITANFIGLHPYYNYMLNITSMLNATDVVECGMEMIVTEQAGIHYTVCQCV